MKGEKCSLVRTLTMVGGVHEWGKRELLTPFLIFYLGMELLDDSVKSNSFSTTCANEMVNYYSLRRRAELSLLFLCVLDY